MFTEYPTQNFMSLFTDDGERKYLNAKERKRFYKARKIIKDKSERSFIEIIFWTGCRISEALQLNIMRVNVSDNFVVFRTLKQHGEHKGKRYRVAHIPRKLMKRLDRIHNIITTQMEEFGNGLRLLWSFGRQKGWRLIKKVMAAAKIFGVRATPKGLRHTFGVHCILCGVPELRLQEWMGHQNLRTTSIYVRVMGAEDRAITKRTWKF